VALGRGQADLGVVLRGAGAELLQSHPYARDRLAVAVFPGHPLAEQSTVTLAEILEHDVVSLDPGTAVQRLVLEKAAAVGRTMRPRVQVRSFEALCQMVAQGLGIGILPETVLRTSANALGLKILVLDETWALRDIDICLPAETQPDAATERLLRVLLSP
jgi:DNA-binding transcriptional LysR family regulator